MKNHYNQDYFEKRDLLTLHIAKTVENIAKKPSSKILDVGCGTGRLLNYLRKKGFLGFGCDNSKEAIKLALEINPKKTVFLANATSLPFKSNYFDIIVSISIIEHLTKAELDSFLQEAKRVLVKNGTIFLITPNFASPAKFLLGKKWFGYQDTTHINFYTKNSLEKQLLHHGFGKINTNFKIDYSDNLQSEFPDFLKILPNFLSNKIVDLVFNSPLSIIRDSIWIQAIKQ